MIKTPPPSTHSPLSWIRTQATGPMGSEVGERCEAGRPKSPTEMINRPLGQAEAFGGQESAVQELLQFVCGWRRWCIQFYGILIEIRFVCGNYYLILTEGLLHSQ